MSGFSPGTFVPKQRDGVFFIDGTHLLKQIEKFPQDRKTKKRLDIARFSEMLQNVWSSETQRMVRLSYYFLKNEQRIQKDAENIIFCPDWDRPSMKRNYQIIECGFKNKINNTEEEEHKEKGVDMRIACDALMLAVVGGVRNFFFLTDDADFCPLFESLQRFGANVYLCGLKDTWSNEHLLKVADQFRSARHLFEDVDNWK